MIGAVAAPFVAPGIAAAANSGDGTMTVTPSTAVAGSTGNAFAFTFTNNSGSAFAAQSWVQIALPVNASTGWTAPTTCGPGTCPATGSNITLTNTSCGSADLYSVVNSGGGIYTITAGSADCPNNGQMTFNFGTTGHLITAPTTPGAYTFTAGSSNSTNGSGSAVNLASEPVVNVTGAVSVTSLSADAGSSGTPVTITGTGFSGTKANDTVDFGTTQATILTANTTSITTTAPAGPTGTVNVTVAVSGVGTSATSAADLFAYAAPTVTAVSPTAGAATTSVTVTGTNFSPGDTVKFGTTSAGTAALRSLRFR
jgi:hypothetical protein